MRPASVEPSIRVSSGTPSSRRVATASRGCVSCNDAQVRSRMSAAARRSASWLTTGTESSPVQQITSIDAERLAAKSAANATAEAARSEPSVRAQRKNQSLAVRETADREPSQLGLKRPPSTSAAPLARFLRPLQMSAVSERFACPSWSAAERADGPLHPSRWRQSYGSGPVTHRSQAWPMAATSAGPPTSAHLGQPGSEWVSCPMAAHHCSSHQAHRVPGCDVGVPVPKTTPTQSSAALTPSSKVWRGSVWGDRRSSGKTLHSSKG